MDNDVYFSHAFANVVFQFGGKRTAADARRVRLDDADRLVNETRRNAQTHRGACDRRRRAGHVRIRARIDV